MPTIATLTLNPAVDFASTAAALRPIHKIRTSSEQIDPGGGGITVARVIHALGGQTLAVHTAGGAIGQLLAQMLEEAGVPHCAVPIAGRTRITFTVHEAETGREYRFVPAGPDLAEAEWHAALAALATTECGYVVASGSLPPGVPADAYAQAARQASARGQHFVLDSSGPALRAALGHGIDLMKPSLEELETLVGRPLPDPAAQEEEAMALVREGAARMVAVSLGAEGAILATRSGVLRRKALAGPVHSAVGAGDAFLAAMVLALARDAGPAEALDWGIAAGAAAVARPGTARIGSEEVAACYRRLTAGTSG